MTKPPSNENINPNKPPINLPETDFIGKTAERAYYRSGNFFIKRTLRPSEYMISQRGTTFIPPLGVQRLKNEAATLAYIRRETNIPVPTLSGVIEMEDSFIMITEYMEGVNMAELKEEQKLVARAEIQQYQAILRELTSDVLGGPSGLLVPPYRVMKLKDKGEWVRKVAGSEKFVFCHNDLSQHNVIVDPESSKITAIIDWEYAGFFPGYFERDFYERPGPSVALEGEIDDSAMLLKFMEES